VLDGVFADDERGGLVFHPALPRDTPSPIGWARPPSGDGGRSIVFEHRVQHAQARPDHQLQQFTLGIDQQIDEGQRARRGRFRDRAQAGYARLPHGGSLLAGLRPG
jgi:hypothetical protein